VDILLVPSIHIVRDGGAVLRVIWPVVRCGSRTSTAQTPTARPTEDAVFRWQTAGLDMTSTVEEVDAPPGDPVTAQPETLQAALDRSWRPWLEDLERKAENRTD
jgi:hypothetical protein